MLCEKCQAKPARVHIKEKAHDNTGGTPGSFIEHHFCEDCGRDFIQSNPRLKTGTWSKPELRRKIEIPDRRNGRKLS